VNEYLMTIAGHQVDEYRRDSCHLFEYTMSIEELDEYRALMLAGRMVVAWDIFDLSDTAGLEETRGFYNSQVRGEMDRCLRSISVNGAGFLAAPEVTVPEPLTAVGMATKMRERLTRNAVRSEMPRIEINTSLDGEEQQEEIDTRSIGVINDVEDIRRDLSELRRRALEGVPDMDSSDRAWSAQDAIYVEQIRRLQEQMQDAIDKWSPTGLLGAVGDPETRNMVALLLENQARETERVRDFEVQPVEECSPFQNMFDVQPMSNPAGLIFFLDYKADEDDDEDDTQYYAMIRGKGVVRKVGGIVQARRDAEVAGIPIQIARVECVDLKYVWSVMCDWCDGIGRLEDDGFVVECDECGGDGWYKTYIEGEDDGCKR